MLDKGTVSTQTAVTRNPLAPSDEGAGKTVGFDWGREKTICTKNLLSIIFSFSPPPSGGGKWFVRAVGLRYLSLRHGYAVPPPVLDFRN